MHVGVVTSSISRNAGGLFHSVRRLSQTIREIGPDVTIFSTRDEFTEEDITAWQPLEPRVYPTIGPARLAWSPEMGRAVGEFSPKDAVLHSHGLWQFASLATLRWRRRTMAPTVISPRGMLDPWAVANSAWRKRIMGYLYEYANLRSASCLHALAESEYQSIRAFGQKNPITIIPNGVDIPSDAELENIEPAEVPIAAKGARVLLFLSRVHPKKGLLPLLEAWRSLGNSRQDWRLVIAGPDEAGHAAEVESRIKEWGLSKEVALIGPQYGDAKKSWLARADAFVLPSFSEGFPMAVLEAMAHRLPVVMTAECNFPEAFQANVALEARPEKNSLRQTLERLLTMSPAQTQTLGVAARSFTQQNYGWPSIAQRMIDVYAWLLGGGSEPESVRTR